jgi:hypothetical protein
MAKSMIVFATALGLLHAAAKEEEAVPPSQHKITEHDESYDCDRRRKRKTDAQALHGNDAIGTGFAVERK